MPRIGGLSVVREVEHLRAIEILRDRATRERILSSIRLGAHARPAFAAEGIPSGSFDSIVARGRAESSQFHDGLVAEPSFFAVVHDEIEKAIGEAFVGHTRELVAAFGEAGFDGAKERAKWMLRRFGPEFAEASAREDELPTRSSEREVRAMLYAKLGLGEPSKAIDVLATEKGKDSDP